MVEIGSKNWFFYFTLRSFLCMLCYTLWVMPQDFANWKILLRYSSVADLIRTGYVVVKFKVFFIDSASMKWSLFGVFLAPYLPKYWSILLKWSDVVLKITNTVFQKSFRLFNFGSNGKHPNFTVLVHFGAQFTARKPKILLKIRISTKITCRPTSLGISNNVNLRFQKNHIILVKLSKKQLFFGGGGGNRTIHLDAMFLGICRSQL